MNVSILQYDESNENYILQPKHGRHAGTVFAVDTKVCDNPVCGCTEIHFSCTPLMPIPSSEVTPLCFSLDVAKRQISERYDRRQSSEASSLAETMTVEMLEEDWDELYRHLVGVKRSQMDEMDCNTLKATFPPEIMSGSASMVAYGEIFPFSDTFAFVLDDDRWLADDQYCVNPECRCEDLILTFFTIPDGPEPPVVEITEEMPHVLYAYKRHTSKVLPSKYSGKPKTNTLMNGLKSAYPELDREVKERHQQLRTLYRNALHREGREATTRVTARSSHVRRNDPCPCGSGKKYKRCCGR